MFYHATLSVVGLAPPSATGFEKRTRVYKPTPIIVGLDKPEDAVIPRERRWSSGDDSSNNGRVEGVANVRGEQCFRVIRRAVVCEQQLVV